MIRTIAQKEIYSALRDRRFLIISSVIILLLLTAVVTGYQSYSTLQMEREVAQQHAEDDFHHQPNRHPHRVAHYGSYAFRPKSPLSFLDPGLDSYTGTMVYLEAHQQNSANFSQAQQSGSILRLGEISIAFVMQWLMPLLIIFLCFNAFTQEKENGTIKLLVSQGISMKTIATGKIMGFSTLILLVVLPAFLVAISFAVFTSGISLNADLLLRLLTLLISYSIYFFVFVVGSILVSALCRQSKTALVLLLGVWIFWCVVIPKTTVSAAETIHSVPSKAMMDAKIHDEAKHGVDGHNPQDQRTREFTEKLLAKYGVDSVSELPVNLGGLLMAEGEAFSSKLYQRHFGKLVDTFTQQNLISTWAGLADPYQAIRDISMSMSGSDFNHYVTFLHASEDYRFKLAQHLNYLQAYKLANKPKDTRLDKSEYSSYPPFNYVAPDFYEALTPIIISLVALCFWAATLYFLSIFLIQKTSNI